MSMPDAKTRRMDDGSAMPSAPTDPVAPAEITAHAKAAAAAGVPLTAVSTSNGDSLTTAAAGVPLTAVSTSNGDSLTEGEFPDDETRMLVALDKLGEAQNEIDRLSGLASHEILRVEQRYNKLKRPLMNERNVAIAKVPHFWLTALLNCPLSRAYVAVEDEAALSHCTVVDVAESEDIVSGFTIVMKFSGNQYFLNTTLTKRFAVTEDGDIIRESSAIRWKPGMNLVSQANEEYEQGHRETPHSFFGLFSNESEMDPGDSLAGLLKDELWPNPLQFYQGEVLEVLPEGEGPAATEQEDADRVSPHEELEEDTRDAGTTSGVAGFAAGVSATPRMTSYPREVNEQDGDLDLLGDSTGGGEEQLIVNEQEELSLLSEDA